VNKWEW